MLPDQDKAYYLQEALKYSFTVDDIKERLKNNQLTLLHKFLQKLKIETTEYQRQSFDFVLEILSSKLATDEGKRAASKILSLATYKELYSPKKALSEDLRAQRESQQKRDEAITLYHKNQQA
jgi:hypothetical protein